MAAPLEVCRGEERRTVIPILGSRGEKPGDINRRMEMQYMCRFCSYKKGTGSLQVGVKFDEYSITLHLGLTLTLKWNE